MNGKKARQARAAASSQQRAHDARIGRTRAWLLLGAVVALVVGASFVLPGVLDRSGPAGTAHSMAGTMQRGTGLPVGSRVPAFAEQDLLTGRTISSSSVYPRKTLLFFSEGVMCQACFQQIQGLQRIGSVLRRRGIQLVSITPDTPADLRQAADTYGITTPLISDADRTMSDAFNTLGQGMHGDTPGHAFALVDRGKVLWYRDYWLAPDRVMYVDPSRLMHDVPVT